MADACNAAQRKLYKRKDGSRFVGDYVDGRGIKYSETLRQLSWPVVSDVPGVGQKSSELHMPEIQHVYGLSRADLYLHPTQYTIAPPYTLHHRTHPHSSTFLLDIFLFLQKIHNRQHLRKREERTDTTMR